MTHDELEQMNRLCQRIQEEKDPVSFDQLTQQLLELLDRAHRRIHPGHQQGAP